MSGQLGLETSPAAYVTALVEVFRGVRRVLRADGLAFVVIGDSYNAYNGNRGRSTSFQGRTEHALPDLPAGHGLTVKSLPPKSLCLVPQRLAIALQDDGWIVRSICIWSKPSCMPECLDPETYVYVKYVDGLIRRVTLDDVLLDGEPYPFILTPGGWQPIHAVWETHKDTSVTMEVAKVSTVTCSPEHLWPVSHDRRRAVIHEKQTCDLRANGYTDYLLHYTIDQWLDGSLQSFRDLCLNYDLGWLLGIYAAEGGFGEVRGHRCKFSLHKDETHITDRIARLADERLGAVPSQREIGNYRTVRFASALWHEVALAIVPGKSTTKSLDLTVVLNAPREFRQGLWDGYIAGDGSGRQKGVIATSASKALRDSMAVVASSIGLITSKGERKALDSRTGNTYHAYYLLTPYTERRQRKAGTTARQLTIRNKRIGPGQRMIDLQVEGGLFLIDDGLVTHNSVQDRPTTAHEYVLMLARSPKYYWDSTAVAERAAGDWTRKGGSLLNRTGWATAAGRNDDTRHPGTAGDGSSRNLRTVWEVSPVPFSAARLDTSYTGAELDTDHYAAYPVALVEPMVKAGTAPQVCGACGSPYRRIVERTDIPDTSAKGSYFDRGKTGVNGQGRAQAGERYVKQAVGWQPGCGCNADVVPATILDPFMGTGTTLLAAIRHGRNGIGIELNHRYCELARARLAGDAPLFTHSGEVAG